MSVRVTWAASVELVSLGWMGEAWGIGGAIDLEACIVFGMEVFVIPIPLGGKAYVNVDDVVMSSKNTFCLFVYV